MKRSMQRSSGQGIAQSQTRTDTPLLAQGLRPSDSSRSERADRRSTMCGTKPAEANLQAFNVEFPIASQGKTGTMRSLVTVKAVPQVEFVLMSGTGYWHDGDGTQWHNFATTHRNRLWANKEMMGGYPSSAPISWPRAAAIARYSCNRMARYTR